MKKINYTTIINGYDNRLTILNGNKIYNTILNTPDYVTLDYTKLDSGYTLK